MTTPAALAATAAALAGASGLPGAGWDELDGPDALEAAAQLSHLKALVDGAMVAVAERLEVTGGPDAAGWASTKDFLTHLTGGRDYRPDTGGMERGDHVRTRPWGTAPDTSGSSER